MSAPTCQVGREQWNAGKGGCESYAPGFCNHKYCDYTKQDWLEWNPLHAYIG